MVGPIEKAGGVSVHTVELSKELRKLGVNVEVYNISPNREYPRWVPNLIKLYKRTLGLAMKLLLDGRSFDIIHIQASGPMGGFLPAVIGALLKKILNFDLIVTFHYSNTPIFVQSYKNLVKFVINSTKKFIVVSAAQKESIIKTLGEQYLDKIVIIPNGFNPRTLELINKEKAREYLNLPLNYKVIFSFGNLLERKGFQYLIDAMEKVAKEMPASLCIIGGAGPLKDKLNKKILQLNLEKHVKLIGFIPDNHLKYWINAADIFVLPSLEEGNPIVMFEVLGMGLPFVGTTVGGVPEIITSEEYGLLCPPVNPECLAEKILIALNKEWDREKIREYAKQFTWENIAKRTLGIYRQVLSKEARNHER